MAGQWVVSGWSAGPGGCGSCQWIVSRWSEGPGAKKRLASGCSAGGQEGQVVSGWSVGLQAGQEDIKLFKTIWFYRAKSKSRAWRFDGKHVRFKTMLVDQSSWMARQEGEESEDDLKASELKYFTVRMRLYIYIYM